MIKRIQKTEAEKAIGKTDANKPAPFLGFSFGERLARNLALSVMLVLTVTAVRTASLPSGQTVLTAVQDMINGQWDDHLGKIDFVSNFFPETVSVFFDTSSRASLTAPCFGEISHAWTQDEPFIAYQSENGRVYASAAGQVMSVAHSPAEELILRVRHEDGLETMYYNLMETAVQEGDQVTESSCLGVLLPGKDAVVEVRRSGLPINPDTLLKPRSGDPS